MLVFDQSRIDRDASNLAKGFMERAKIGVLARRVKGASVAIACLNDPGVPRLGPVRQNSIRFVDCLRWIVGHGMRNLSDVRPDHRRAPWNTQFGRYVLVRVGHLDRKRLAAVGRGVRNWASGRSATCLSGPGRVTCRVRACPTTG